MGLGERRQEGNEGGVGAGTAGRRRGSQWKGISGPWGPDSPLGSWLRGADAPAPPATPQNPAERGHKVRLAVGSGLRPDAWERFVRRFGPLQVLETYGLTEGNVATFNYTGRRGAVGRASWLYKVRGPRKPRGQQGAGRGELASGTSCI